MRILYIQCTSDLYGASRSLLRTTARLVSDGHHVVVVLGEEGPLNEALKVAGVHTKIIPLDPTLRKRCFKSFGGVIRLLRECGASIKAYSALAKKHRIDLIYSNTSQTVTGGLVARKLKIPHIMHVRESYADFHVFWLVYRRFILMFSSKVVCVSDAIARQFPARLIGKKVSRRHNGFPIDEFDPVDDSRRRAFLESHGLTEDQTLVGLVGRVILQRKGQDVFVKAVAKIKADFPDAKFLIIGSCFKGNEYHLVDLTTLIEDLQVSDRVILTGEVQDIKAAYSALDLSILASATPEPFGGVTIESMAMGVPVIGTAIGGTPEQITDEVTGLLVPPNDVDALAKAMSRLLGDAGLRRRMGTAARTSFERRFTFEPYYEEMIEILTDAINRGGAGK